MCIRDSTIAVGTGEADILSSFEFIEEVLGDKACLLYTSVARELRATNMKVVSLAPEVL